MCKDKGTGYCPIEASSRGYCEGCDPETIRKSKKKVYNCEKDSNGTLKCPVHSQTSKGRFTADKLYEPLVDAAKHLRRAESDWLRDLAIRDIIEALNKLEN